MILFRLALRLGKTPSEFLHSLRDSRELGELIAFYDIEPHNRDAELMFGGILAGIYNSSGRAKKAYKPTDFAPEHKRSFESAAKKRKRVADKIRAIFGKGK
jgi:hypothetical protein